MENTTEPELFEVRCPWCSRLNLRATNGFLLEIMCQKCGKKSTLRLVCGVAIKVQNRGELSPAQRRPILPVEAVTIEG